MKRFVAWMMRRVNICGARSPEGYICNRTYKHNGSHVDHKGSGYAWG